VVEAVGGKVEEYIIPDRDKAAVLEKLYIFDPVPSLYETMFDVYDERHFKVEEFRGVRDAGMDMLVSPYFFNSGGTVIDWLPPDVKPGQTDRRKVRGSEGFMETMYLGPMKQFAHWAAQRVASLEAGRGRVSSVGSVAQADLLQDRREPWVRPEGVEFGIGRQPCEVGVFFRMGPIQEIEGPVRVSKRSMGGREVIFRDIGTIRPFFERFENPEPLRIPT